MNNPSTVTNRKKDPRTQQRERRVRKDLLFIGLAALVLMVVVVTVHQLLGLPEHQSFQQTVYYTLLFILGAAFAIFVLWLADRK